MPWSQLTDIRKEAQAERLREMAEPPVSCPIDGAVLTVHQRTGERDCPMGNYRWRGGPKG